RRAGCLVSMNGMMLATRRGREYARIIPQKQLLLETDAPAEQGAPGAAADLEATLQATLSRLAQIRGVDEAGLGRAVAERGAELLGL
ncbi:TatD family hydrolase, partial [Anaerotignum lactatifermentans]|uniref:TatD family hydrolase n=1 Tax=Anaerotignum lactatifermentans TaxID=160404 RepID=UPI0018736044